LGRAGVPAAGRARRQRARLAAARRRRGSEAFTAGGGRVGGARRAVISARGDADLKPGARRISGRRRRIAAGAFPSGSGGGGGRKKGRRGALAGLSIASRGENGSDAARGRFDSGPRPRSAGDAERGAPRFPPTLRPLHERHLRPLDQGQILQRRRHPAGAAQGAHRAETAPAPDRGAPAGDRRGGVQHLSAEHQRRVPGHADGLRHERDERQPGGVDVAGGRCLCGFAEFRAHGGGGARGVRDRARDSGAPGPGGGKRDFAGLREARGRDPDELPLHDHEGPHGAQWRAHLRDLHRRGAEDPEQPSVQGQHRHRETGAN
jgi:hypothetical protein